MVQTLAVGVKNCPFFSRDQGDLIWYHWNDPYPSLASGRCGLGQNFKWLIEVRHSNLFSWLMCCYFSIWEVLYTTANLAVFYSVMSYSDIFVCLSMWHKEGPWEKLLIIFFNILHLKCLKLDLKKLHKTKIFTVCECKILTYFWHEGGERERSNGNDLFCTEIGQWCLLGKELVFHWIFE